MSWGIKLALLWKVRRAPNVRFTEGYNLAVAIPGQAWEQGPDVGRLEGLPFQSAKDSAPGVNTQGRPFVNPSLGDGQGPVVQADDAGFVTFATKDMWTLLSGGPSYPRFECPPAIGHVIMSFVHSFLGARSAPFCRRSRR